MTSITENQASSNLKELFKIFIRIYRINVSFFFFLLKVWLFFFIFVKISLGVAILGNASLHFLCIPYSRVCVPCVNCNEWE